MFSLIIGSIILVGTLFYSLQNDGTATHFVTTHSLILVVIGSLGILFLSTPSAVLKVLAQLLVDLMRPEDRIGNYRNVLQELSKNPMANIKNKNALLSYANELWARGVERDLFLTLLSEKRREIDLRNMDAVQALKNLGKYPPALGMIGTVIGMLGLFANLDKNRDNIGKHLSLALTATFVGLVVSNIIASPLADRLQIHQAKAQQVNTHLYELLLLINNREPNTLIEEEINGRAA
jgi:chemotaxis protein MotA